MQPATKGAPTHHRVPDIHLASSMLMRRLLFHGPGYTRGRAPLRWRWWPFGHKRDAEAGRCE